MDPIADSLSAADVARERAADPSITASAHARLVELAEQADEAMEGAWFATNHVETSGCEAEFISWCSPMTILRLLREHELFRQALLAHPARGVVDEVALAEVIQDHTGCGDSDSIYAAHAVIQRLQAAALPAVPSDWVMVPRVPTEPMVWEFCAERPATTYLTHTTLQCADFASRYAAMLAATPAHDQPEGEG